MGEGISTRIGKGIGYIGLGKQQTSNLCFLTDGRHDVSVLRRSKFRGCHYA